MVRADGILDEWPRVRKAGCEAEAAGKGEVAPVRVLVEDAFAGVGTRFQHACTVIHHGEVCGAEVVDKVGIEEALNLRGMLVSS